MAQLLNLETGTVEVVPDEQVTAAVGSGRFSLPKSERVEVVDADGNRGTIAPEEAVEAFGARGYRFVTPSELEQERIQAEFGDRPIAAGAAGLARGASFGLSDVALSKTGLVEERTLEGLQQANPEVSTGTEIAGAVLPALIPGGQFTAAGAAARAGTSIATRLGGTTAAKVAGGVVEQGLFGAGHLVSEAALGDAELTGEKLLAEAGLSTLLGAGGGLVGELGSAALRRAGRGGRAAAGAVDDVARAADDVVPPGPVVDEAIPTPTGAPTPPTDFGFERPLREVVEDPRIGKKAAEFLEEETQKRAGTVKGILEDMGLDWPTAEKWVLRDLDLTKSQVNKLRESKFGGLDVSAPRALLDDARYAKTKTLKQKVALIETKQTEAAQAIDEAVTRFDELAEPGLRPNYADVATKIREQLIAPRAQGLSTLEAPILKRLEEVAAEIETRPNTTFLDAERLKRSFDPFLKWDSQTEAPMRDALRQVRGILNAEIEAKAAALAQKAGADTFTRWKDAKRLYAGMTELLDPVADREMARSAGNRYFSLTDNMAGGAALIAGGLNPMGLALSAGAAAFNKWGRERLPHLLALWMKRAETGTTRKAATGLKRLVDAATPARTPMPPPPTPGIPGAGAVDEAVGPFWRYTSALAQASARGAPALFALHAALVDSDPEYRDTMEEHGLTVDPSLEMAAEEKSTRLDELEERAAALDKRLDDAVTGFLSGKKRTSPSLGLFGSGPERLRTFRERVDEVANLATNPQAIAERITAAAGTDADAPAITAALVSTATRAAQFLHERAPKAPPSAMDVPALRKPWRPSDAEVARWERMVAAVENPGGVLEDMAAGVVTREAVEALQAVYPRVYEEAKQRIMERLATHPDALTYQQRIRLGSVLGVPLDESAKPESLARLQASFQQPEPPQRPPSRSTSGASELAAAEMTQSERLLSRRN